MRSFELWRAWPIAVLLLALGCQSDQLLDPVAPPPDHPGLDAIAVRLEVDVMKGTVRVLPSSGAAQDSGGPSLAILGINEVSVTATNLVRSAPVNGKVIVTFDAAVTNRLTSASLVPSTFPSATGGPGLVLFPFQVTQVVGGTAAQVAASPDWNGDGSAGSGGPRNFFNDVGCPNANALADCFRWEQYPAPLGPGETLQPGPAPFRDDSRLALIPAGTAGRLRGGCLGAQRLFGGGIEVAAGDTRGG